jgi:hypothetical protein
MPKFRNYNRHRAYVDDPEVGLVRLLPQQEVEASGQYADNLEATAGVHKVGTKEAKEAQKRLDVIETNLEHTGPEAFPATDDKPSGPSPAEKGEKAEGDLLTDTQREQRAESEPSGGAVTTDKVSTSTSKKKSSRKSSSRKPRSRSKSSRSKSS